MEVRPAGVTRPRRFRPCASRLKVELFPFEGEELRKRARKAPIEPASRAFVQVAAEIGRPCKQVLAKEALLDGARVIIDNEEELSAVLRAAAAQLGYVYVDTGAMYRAVTLYALRAGLFGADGSIDSERLQQLMPQIQITFKFNAETGRPDTYLNGSLVEREIRSIEVSSHVSPVATLAFVRSALVEQQQAMGRDKGIVMDGRDIGTTVFPDAELKIFVTASAEVRAQRRYDELKAKGMEADYDDILKNVQERDYIDSHREVSPLRQADDAILLDNSHMTIPEQKQWLMDQYLAKVNA